MRPSGKADERGPTSSRNERRVSDQLPAIGSFRFPRVAMLAFGRLGEVTNGCFGDFHCEKVAFG